MYFENETEDAGGEQVLPDDNDDSGFWLSSAG